MTYFLKVTWTKQGTSTEVDITDAIKVNFKKGLKAKVNTASLQLKNSFLQQVDDRSEDESATGRHKITEDDVIKIYASWDNIDTSNPAHLLFIGDVIAYSGNMTSKKRFVTIKCADKTWLALNKVWSQTYSDTPDDIIKNLISQATGNSNDSTEDDIQIPSDSAKFAQTRSDDSAFPTIQIGFTFKPIYEWISQMSSTGYLSDSSYTEPRDYIFFVDENNELNWFAPKDAGSTLLNGALTSTATSVTVDSTTGFASSGSIFIGNEWISYTSTTSTTFDNCTRGINFTVAEAHDDNSPVKGAKALNEGVHDIFSAKLERNTDQQVNMIIYRCGKDLYGNGITWYNYFTGQTSRVSNNKLKIKFYNWPQISTDVLWKGHDQDLAGTSYDWTGLLNQTKTLLNGAAGSGDGTVTVDDASSFLNSNPSWFLVGNPQDYNFVSYTGVSSNDFTTCTWDLAGSSNAGGNYADNTPVYEADGIYSTIGNSNFRNMCKKKGYDMSQKILARYADLRWKGSVVVRGYKYAAGDLIYVNLPSIGVFDILRVHDVTHQFGKTWTTTLKLEQDEPKQA